MGQSALINIVRHSFNTEEALDKMIEYLKPKKINGLHYVNFISSKGVSCIVKPDYTTHNEATDLLLEIYSSGDSPNTLRSTAYDLTKFLDYLMLFDIKLEDVKDLEEILIGFVLYLQVLGTKKLKVTKSIIWSLIDYLPLIDDGIKDININEYGKRSFNTANQLSEQSIVSSLQNAFKYIDFYNKIIPIAVDSIPRKNILVSTSFSSTNKTKHSTVTYDSKAIFSKAGMKYKSSSKKASPVTEKIPTLEEMMVLIDSLPLIKTTNINKLVIFTLRGFGLREAELTNIKFDTSMLPSNFLSMRYDEALSTLKEQKFGDLYYNKKINKWVCEVSTTPDSIYSRRNKSHSREVFYIFEQEELTNTLYSALRERQLLIKVNNYINPLELFVSRKNSCKPMTGSTVYSIVKTICKKIHKESGIDFSYINPHSFRHYFATHLFRCNEYSLSDVSRFLGHSDTEITRITYIHYLSDNKPDSIVSDVIETIKR